MFYRRRIQDQLNHNTELELTLTKLENHIKELENKIEILKVKELNQENDDLMEVIILSINLYFERINGLSF